MATNNAEYWARRMKLLEEALADQGFDYVQNLEKQFDRAIAQIEKETAAWYQRFADNLSLIHIYTRSGVQHGGGCGAGYPDRATRGAAQSGVGT